jgi:hypothetical protein
MSGNMDLWHKVEKTPESQTKAITGKPYKGTSPKPYYLVQKATETFGPCGIGWGLEIVNERVENGSEGDKVHIAHIRVWYEWEGKRGVVEHVGQTMLAGKNRNGPFTDEDAPKKSVTDALVKALSMIGFAGDIFMGRYDDSKYVSDLKQEEKAEASKPSQQGSAKVIENLWAEIIELKSERALASFWKDNVKTILGMDEVSRKNFVDKKDELKAKFAGNVVNDIQDTFPGSSVVNETVREQHVLEAGE